MKEYIIIAIASTFTFTILAMTLQGIRLFKQDKHNIITSLILTILVITISIYLTMILD